jgi:hypothetical protein
MSFVQGVKYTSDYNICVIFYVMVYVQINKFHRNIISVQCNIYQLLFNVINISSFWLQSSNSARYLCQKYTSLNKLTSTRKLVQTPFKSPCDRNGNKHFHPWLRRLVTGLLRLRPRFAFRSVHLGFVGRLVAGLLLRRPGLGLRSVYLGFVGRLVAGLLLRTPGFGLRSVYLGFVGRLVAGLLLRRQAFLRFLVSPVSIIPPWVFNLIYRLEDEQ